MKTLEKPEAKTALRVAEKNFVTRQAERKAKMDTIKEEMERWRCPQRVEVVLSRKYR